MKNKPENKNEWDLSCFYSSPSDPQISKDMATITKKVGGFARKYKDSSEYLKNPTNLLQAIQEFEKISSVLFDAKPLMYLYLYRTLHSSDAIAEAKFASISSSLTEAGNQILFFTNQLAKIDSKQQKIFLKNKELEKYHYFLSSLFKEGKHLLSDETEKALSLMDQPASQMWVSGVEKARNTLTITDEDTDIRVEEVFLNLKNYPTKKRRQLFRQATEKLKEEVGSYSEGELNALYTHKKITDKLRNFKKPYDSVLLQHQISATTVENVVDTVTNNFDISQDFYRIKTEMLKMKKLTYADRSADVGSVKRTFSFDETTDFLMKTFSAVDPVFGEFLSSFMTNRQIDVFPRKGKQGGAFCMGFRDAPTFVFLNHVNDFYSVLVTAHELGHAFHTELYYDQPLIYRGYSTATAEVASTFFEQLAFDTFFETLSDREKVSALHDRIQGDVATIFRQIAGFNFEQDLHLQIRDKGFLQKEEIATLMNTHMKSYLGPTVELDESDGYFFIAWPHIRRFSYVYSYAFGQLVSRFMYEEYKKDPAFISKVKKVLQAGSSDTVENIFKSIGINVSKKDLFEKGLAGIRNDIATLKKLISKQKK